MLHVLLLCPGMRHEHHSLVMHPKTSYLIFPWLQSFPLVFR